MKKKSFLFFILLLIAVIFTALYGYTQFSKKKLISAVLQHQVDLNNPPDSVSAISTYDQKLPDRKTFLKGTRLIGMVAKENENFVIYFNSAQTPGNKEEQFSGKSVLNIKSKEEASGVSEKIGKTLYKQTKTNVLGAIFKSSSSQDLSNSILPQGYSLKIEIN